MGSCGFYCLNLAVRFRLRSLGSLKMIYPWKLRCSIVMLVYRKVMLFKKCVTDVTCSWTTGQLHCLNQTTSKEEIMKQPSLHEPRCIPLTPCQRLKAKKSPSPKIDAQFFSFAKYEHGMVKHEELRGPSISGSTWGTAWQSWGDRWIAVYLEFSNTLRQWEFAIRKPP